MSLNVSRINPKDLLRKQIIDGEFIRWDTIIRWITAEHYIKTRRLHYLYIKDCKLKHEYVNGDDGKYLEESACENFKGIIRSFILFKKFSTCNPVAVDKDLILSDGTHRLGVALAMNLKFMYYKVVDNKHLVLDQVGVARLDYYEERFTEEEIKLMADKYDELFKGE